MPIHDWSRVDAGLFHAFHLGWIVGLSQALNSGLLPSGHYALPEPSIGGQAADVLPLNSPEDLICAHKADRITVRNGHDHIIAVVEIVSPGNKSSNSALRSFVEKAVKLLDQGIHLLVIDPFRPTKRDPKGIHKAIWDEFLDEDFEPPIGLPLTLVSYDAGPPLTAYVEPVAIGDVLPDMPLFLKPGFHVSAPLEASYQTTWGRFPAPMKKLLEGPRYGPDVV